MPTIHRTTSTRPTRTRPGADRPGTARRGTGERGEGVISTAIAVLIMAFLGAAMWVTFNGIWRDTADNTERQVTIIGSDGATSPSGG